MVEFNLRLCKIKSYNMNLPDNVLAYYLLDCVNLSDEQTSLCRATCAKLTYADMKTQIERVAIPTLLQPVVKQSTWNLSMWPTITNTKTTMMNSMMKTIMRTNHMTQRLMMHTTLNPALGLALLSNIRQ